jgi:hypothetical protein
MSASTLMLIGLSWGGVVFSWNSAHVLVTLILGFAIFVGAGIWEGRFAKSPLIPSVLVTNRTSVNGYLLTFLHGMVSAAFICK